jgi:pyruvate kinase
MVARGDLGVEVDIHRIGILQKEIIQQCRQQRTPVIVATQMLESMTERPGPTRAEATDVTNAILDGTDAVMLSGETATGRYPFEAVRTMRRIAEATESYLRRTGRPMEGTAPRLPAGDPLFSITHAGITAACDTEARAIIVHTLSGRTARLLSRYHPDCPVLAFTPSPTAWRQMNILYGVYPQRIGRYRSSDQLVRRSEERVRRLIPIDRPTYFVILSGRAFTLGATNTLRIRALQPLPAGAGKPDAPFGEVQT